MKNQIQLIPQLTTLSSFFNMISKLVGLGLKSQVFNYFNKALWTLLLSYYKNYTCKIWQNILFWGKKSKNRKPHIIKNEMFQLLNIANALKFWNKYSWWIYWVCLLQKSVLRLALKLELVSQIFIIIRWFIGIINVCQRLRH